MDATVPDTDVKHERRPRFDRAVGASIIGLFTLASLAAMFYARAFVLPVVLAVLLALTLSPLVRYLSRRGIPPPVTAITLVIAVASALVVSTAYLSSPVARMVEQLPNIVEQAREQARFLGRSIGTVNEAVRAIQALVSGNDIGDEEATVVMADPWLATWAAGAFAGIGTTLGVALVLAFFLLATSESLRLKIVRLRDGLGDKKKALKTLHDIENDVSRYLVTIAAINAGFGAAVGLGMYLIGLPNPLIWGIMAGLLNFVPYLGGLVGITLIAFASLAEFGTTWAAVAPPLAYVALQIVESNFVTPTILGRRLQLHIVAVLLFVGFSTWMWGIFGTLIAVPLLVVIKAIVANAESLKTVDVLLGIENAAAEEEAGHQRSAATEPLPTPRRY